MPAAKLLQRRQLRAQRKADEAAVANRPHSSELATLGEIGRLRKRFESEGAKHPIEALVAACNEAAVNVAMLRHITGERESLLGVNRFGEESIHPLADHYAGWLDRQARLAKLALDANIDQQRLNIAEETTRANLTRFQRALSDAGLSPSQQEAVNDALSRQVAAPLD